MWQLVGAETRRFFDREKGALSALLQDPYIQELRQISTFSSNARKSHIKRGVFVIPSLEEVKSYCEIERKNSVNAELFLDFYEARGWKVGRVPMKDWRAAVRTWERNQDFQRPQEKPKPQRCAIPGHFGLTNTGRCWSCVNDYHKRV